MHESKRLAMVLAAIFAAITVFAAILLGPLFRQKLKQAEYLDLSRNKAPVES